MHGFSKLHASLTTAALVVSLLLGAPSLASAQSTGVVPGNLRAYSTIHSIGLEWHVTGDGNHNASATVEYRAQGSEAWRDALPLVRVDNNGANMLAGSVLFLEPGTLYDVRVSLSDPDGGADSRMVAVATRALPTLPLGGRTFHVVPGTGGGQGSSSDPFKGIAAAQAVAQPGDVFLLHTGAYGGRIRFAKSGTAQKHVVWKAAGDGEVRMDGVDIAASHVWVEGVTVRNQSFAMLSSGAPENVVVIRCAFYNNHYGLHLSGGGKDWYIADNTIVGDTPYTTGSFSGEGIDLAKTGGHTVAHNSITNVADGISYPSTNVDIFGNDIFDTSDDGIEADNGLANVRIWGNRIHNAAHNGITFQPQSGAPWYIIRNQIIGNMEGAFKFRTTDRFVLMHNTIVSGGRTSDDAMICCNEHHLLNAIARNNLWISARGGQIWGFGTFSKDWRTDLDFDGFDWGASTRPFAYQGLTYRDLPSFAAASGLERHGVHVSRDTCFETFDVPGPAPTPIPPQVLSLQPGCAAMDAGVALPNINDGFAGAAPDMGAYEYGLPAPVFGPRAAVVDVPPPPAPAPTPAPTSDTTPPTARITSPSGNVWTGSSILIAASATDNAVLKHIELWGAGKVFATLPCSGTSCSGSSRWSTSALTTGAYQVHAVAVDAAGNRTLSTPILVYKNGTSPLIASGATGGTAPASEPTPAPTPTPLTVAVTSPASGATVTGTTSVAFTTTGASGSLTVVPSVDGAALPAKTVSGTSGTVSIDTTKYTNGSHSIGLKVTDGAGKTASTALTVTVSNTTSGGGTGTGDITAPTARITSPSGNVWTGSSILIAASATDNAALKHIELWGAGKVFATLPCSGTSCSGSSRWSTSALTTGAYQVHAVAVDAAGNRTLSTPILVYKNGTSPQVASGATGATAPTPAPPPTSTTGDATAPTAGITSPTGSVWTGNSIGVSASASDDVGLATITLWGNGVRFGTITCSGGSCSGTIRWTTGALLPGAYEVNAVATDTAGNCTVSSAVTIYKDARSPVKRSGATCGAP